MTRPAAERGKNAMSWETFVRLVACILLCGAAIGSTLHVMIGGIEHSLNPLWLCAPFVCGLVAGALLPR